MRVKFVNLIRIIVHVVLRNFSRSRLRILSAERKHCVSDRVGSNRGRGESSLTADSPNAVAENEQREGERRASRSQGDHGGQRGSGKVRPDAPVHVRRGEPFLQLER